MELDLSEIVMREGMVARVEVDQPEVPDPDLSFATPVLGQLKFQNAGDLLNVTGWVRTTLRIACSRCLIEVCVPVELAIEERMPLDEVRHPRPPAEAAIDSLVASVVHLVQGRPILDTDELIRQHLLLEVPIRVLCDAACRGLCPTCGANLNEGPCVCAPERRESPLAALASLLEERNGV